MSIKDWRVSLCALILSLLLILSQVVVFADEVPKVQFDCKSDNFTVTPQSSDLFINFKEVMPGDEIQQHIEVECTNCEKSSQTEIFLKADYSQMSQTQKDFLQNMTLEVMQGENTIYNSQADKQSTLENDVLLYKFNSDNKIDLLLNLTISKEMGNDFADNFANLKWIFSANTIQDTITTVSSSPSNPSNPNTTSTTTPATGGSYRYLWLIVGVGVVAGLGLIIIVLHTKKLNK